MQKDKKILLHACCAICSGYPITLLQNIGYQPIVYFYNPNIDSIEEFNRRLEAQVKLCSHFNIELLVEPYYPQEYLDFVKGFELEPEKGKRCFKCVELRLKKTAQKAQNIGINEFTTSLVISPHKNFDKISLIGKNMASLYNLNYLAIDFKKKNGFLHTNNISKELGLYRQNYCGCKFAK